MQFERLVELASDLHCFSPGMVTAGESLERVRIQLSRWVQSGKAIRIHKGWYTLNKPYRRAQVDMNVVATLIKPGTYVSLHSALAFHGLIPEYVAETTCVTTGRPQVIDSPFGRIHYRHVKTVAFFGYARHVAGLQHAYVATPEKALLDLLYLTPGSDDADYLSELRLQGVEELDADLLQTMARRFEAPKLERGTEIITREIAEGADIR